MQKEGRQTKRLVPKILAGLMLMALGLAMLLNNLGILSMDQALRFWPLMTLVPIGLERLWSRGFLGSAWGHILILGGIAAQLFMLDRAHWVEKWWPMGVLWMGLATTLRALYGERQKAPEEGKSEQDSPERLS